jgi:hypothetical protein
VRATSIGLRRQELGFFALVGLTLAAALLLVPRATPAVTPALTVSGVAGNGFVPKRPLKLTMAQLAALQQATVTVKIGGVKTIEKGPPVTELLAKANFTGVPGCDPEEDNLRYWIQASGRGGVAAVMAGTELDPDGGNRLAILSLEENGKALASPRLVIRGGRTTARDISNVYSLTVGRAAPQLFSENEECNPPGFRPPLNTVPDAGAVIINGAVAHPTTLTFAQLQALPQLTQNDTYLSHGAPRTRQEKGPSLYSILAAADPQFQSGPNDKLRFYIEVTSSEDGEPVLVSWAEIDPSLDNDGSILSLVEDGEPILDTDPGARLTVPGDRSGERYNYGVQVVTVFRTPPAAS